MDKLAYKYQEYRTGAALEASPSNEAAQGILDQMKAAARSVGVMGPETPSIMSPTGDLGAMPKGVAEEKAASLDILSAGKGPLKSAPADTPELRPSSPQETQKAKAAPTAQEAYDPSQAGLVESSVEAAKSQGAQALAGTYAGAADFYGTLDGLSAIVARKAGMGKPEVFDYLKRSSEYWAEHYQSKISIDDYMTRVVGGVLGSGPALVEFAMGPEWAALKGFAQDGQLGDALYSAARRVAAGAVFKSAHTLDAAGRIAAGATYMTGESVAEQLGQTGKIDAGQTAEAAGVGLGMMLSGGLGPGTGKRLRVNPETWFETSKQGNEIYRALDEGRIDPVMKDLAKEFYTSDLMRGGTALNDTSLAVIDKLNLLRKGVDDWIIREQGIKVDPEKEYKILGKTTNKRATDGTYKTAIELFQGADADTLVEEWMHREYDRLPNTERRAIMRAYEAYKAALPEGQALMNQAEFYAKGATDKFFAAQVAAQKAADRPAWTKAVDAAKERWNSFVGAVQSVPGAKPLGSAPALDMSAQGAFKAGERMQIRPVDEIVYDPTPQQPMSRKYAAEKGVNLLRINSDADLNRVVELIAQENIDSGAYAEQTRGKVSWDKTREESGIPLAGAAASEGQKPAVRADEMLLRKQGDILNASQATAARLIHRELMAQMFELVETAKRTGSDADMDTAAHAVDVFAKIDASLMGYRAEQARGLQAWAMPVGDVRTQVPVGAFSELAAKHGGDKNAHAILDTLHDMMKMSADGKLDMTEVSRFLNKVEKASTFDMILEARYMAMLANPATHIKNTLGNSIALGSQVLERGVAEGIGAVRNIFSKDAIDRVEAGETVAMMYGGIEGLRAGAQAFLKAVRTGESTDPMGKLETVRRAITAENLGVDPKDPWGKMIDFTAERLRTGNMMLGAEDDFFKAVGYSMELNARAHRTATAEGLKGQDFADRVQELVSNPPWQMQMQAMDFAHYSTFTNALGEGMTKLQSALGTDYTVTLKSGKTYEVPTGKLFRLAVPFFRTPANIVSYGMKRSPFAVFMPSVQQDLINGGAARDMALSRITLGSTLGFMAAQAAASGLITGGGPSDPKQKENLREVGWQPYSVKVGDKWISYQSLEPYSMVIGAAADIALFDDYLEENERNNAAMMVAGAFSQAVTSKTFMQGMAGMIDVLQDPDRYGDRYAQQFAASFVPSPIKALRRDVDPIVREIWTVSDALNNSLPWKSSDLYPRRNRYGEPITVGDVWLSNLVDPMRKTQIKNEENSPTYAIDKVIQENNISIPRAQKTIHWQGVGVALTPEEYDRYQQIPQEVGMLDQLQRVVSSPEFERATGGPDGLKAHMVKEVFLNARERARYEIVRESQGIPGGLAERIELERLDRQMKGEAMQ